ncbi:MAG: hypothetical protein ACE5E7_02975 [Anaerolineae bacterium]
MKKNWMAELAHHYEKTRKRYPQDKLIILFDIDGTILDMRHMILSVLHAYDREHDTRLFRHFRVEDIKVHENHVKSLLEQLPVPPEHRNHILVWYEENRWSSSAILESHRPFSGVLEVIRWFQIQPNTFVGLNTGRPEAIRADTLRSLNKLAKAYRVQFDDALLHMNPGDWEEDVATAKREGIRYFQRAGYRVFAYVDNEPKNLTAASKIDPDREILLLHANTIFESKRTRLPPHSVRGEKYQLTGLISEKALPRNVQFVWHGVNDRANLRQFLASDIRWAEVDVHLDPTGSELILRHDSFFETPLVEDEDWLTLNEVLVRLRERDKAVKLDLKAGGFLVDKALEQVGKLGFNDKNLWFNGNVERLQEHRIRQIAEERPGAILQVPVDFLAPLVCTAPEKAKEILDMFASWGVNRFSISWLTRDMHLFLDRMDEWGFDANIYNVPDLESFLQAVLLLPRSVTADFNFPEWHYYGRGSGHNSRHYEYTMREVQQRRG